MDTEKIQNDLLKTKILFLGGLSALVLPFLLIAVIVTGFILFTLLWSLFT